jgi:purine nucleosidase/pyrimidine-specific ribonucleoside hydrolase
MGGSMGLGNTTPAAEFNVYVDPEAARIVFESGLPVTMVGLDVTHQAGVGREEAEKMRGLGRAGEAAADLVGFFASTYLEVFGFEEPPIHDAVAVAAVADRGVITTRKMRVDVECEGEFTRGETVCDLYGVTGREPNARVGLGLDRECFFDLLYRSLAALG